MSCPTLTYPPHPHLWVLVCLVAATGPDSQLPSYIFTPLPTFLAWSQMSPFPTALEKWHLCPFWDCCRGKIHPWNTKLCLIYFLYKSIVINGGQKLWLNSWVKRMAWAPPFITELLRKNVFQVHVIDLAPVPLIRWGLPCNSMRRRKNVIIKYSLSSHLSIMLW